jgi:hypothetical protein
VKVQGHSIIVTMLDTDFSVTYEKRADNPHVVFTRSWISPTEATPTMSEFRSSAFRLAVAKARELGWIV